MKFTIKYTGLTVRSSRYMVFDKKSMPIVACKTIIALKHGCRHNTCITDISQNNHLTKVYDHMV